MIRIANNLLDIKNVSEIDKETFVDYLPYDFMQNDFLTNPDCKYIVYEDEGVIKGYAIIWVTDNTQILNFAVKKEFRGQGIGSMILEEVIKQSVGAITLEVRESNETAIKLYEKFGFTFSHKRLGYYSNGENALFLVRW